MKILYDCFSCSPYYGSDEEIGWMWPYLMSRYHEVWALVRKDRAEDIEKYGRTHDISHIHFVYCDIPDSINFYYSRRRKGKNGVLDFLAYQYLWQYVAFRTAKKLNKEITFDVVHHVSTNDFRLIGFMYKLGIPYIIGPIGGAQETPEPLRYYVRDHKKAERFRLVLNRIMVNLPGYKKALNNADRIYFSNPETERFLSQYINNMSKCELLSEIGCREPREDITNDSNDNSSNDESIFMWAGRMEYRKGLEFLVDVLKKLPLNLEWKIILCGDGTEKDYIQELCSKEDFNSRVIFMGKIPYEEVQKLYSQSRAFVFPSLRETTGTVILEAMSNKLPVICLNQGGGALIVNSNCGYVIDGNTKEDYIQKFANAMLECINNPKMVQRMGIEAYKRAMSEYSWERKIQYCVKKYELICKKKIDYNYTRENRI